MSNKEMATEKRLKVRLYLSLLVYAVVGYGLTLRSVYKELHADRETGC